MSEHPTLPDPARTTRSAVLQGEGATAVLAALEPALIALATPEGEAAPVLATLNLDLVRPAAAGQAITLHLWIERTTRTLVFAAADVRLTADDSLIGAGQAVLKRPVS